MSIVEEIKSNLIEAQRSRIAELKEENEKLQAENNQLRAALEVYADDGNWIGSNMDEFEFACGYTIAQEALKGE